MTIYKRCYKTKAQTDNAEHINRFSILLLLFYERKIQIRRITMFGKQSLFGELKAKEDSIHTFESWHACYFIIVKQE